MKRKFNLFILTFVLAFLLSGNVYAKGMEEATPLESTDEEYLNPSAFEEEPLNPSVSGEENLVPTAGHEKEEEDQPQALEIEGNSKPTALRSPAGQAEGTQPAENPPAEEQPAGNPPTEDPPTEDPPAENPPAKDPWTKELEDLKKKIEEEKDPEKKEALQKEYNDKKELKDLENKIQEEKDPGKKKALQKEYNDKYLDRVVKDEAEKLDDESIKRLKPEDKDRIDSFYELQKEYKALLEKKKEGKLSQKDIDGFKKKLESFKLPRLIVGKEKEILDKFYESTYIPGLAGNPGQKWKDKFEEYKKAKEALEAALDPESEPTDIKKLNELLDKFKDLEAKIKKAIEDGELEASFTKDRKPEVRVFPMDFSGKPGYELQDQTYYIPDGTPLELLVQVNKDKSDQDFTFTLRTKGGEAIPKAKLSNLVFLMGKPVELTDNKDGSYSFKTNRDQNFGIAQMRFRMEGFYEILHKGFTLEMKAGEKTFSKDFLITKKGYEDLAEIGGPGNKEKEKAPEVDAGETEDARVVGASAKEIYDFFSILKKSNVYIDNVLINSSSGKSLPMSSAEITIKMPEDNGSFAKYVHKSGLAYHDNGDGTYTLKLDLKDFGANLEKKEDGLYFNGNKLDKAGLTDVILEEAGKRVYVDSDGTAHEIINKEVLSGNKYKVEDGKLSEKDANGDYTEIGSFDSNGKLVKGGITYALEGDKVISYTSETPVFEGNVANKDGKADPTVSPTLVGKQVTVIGKDGKKSYGGTILEDSIYRKTDSGYVYVGKSKDKYVGYKEAIVDDTGKKMEDDLDLTDGKTISDKDGIKTVEKGSILYRLIQNPVFEGGYLITGLEYRDGLSLVNTQGRLYEDISVSEESGKYTFKKKGHDDRSTGVGPDLTVGNSDESIYVDNKNYLIDDTTGYEQVTGKYYFDGQKFVKAEDSAVRGEKVLVEYKELERLNKKTVEVYKDGSGNEQKLPDNPDRPKYSGSTKPEDYFKVAHQIYVKNGDVYVKVKGNSGEQDYVLSEKAISKIVQTLGSEEKIVPGDSIFDLVLASKFGLKFPGFLAGKGILYNLKGIFKGTYKKPVEENGKTIFEDVSIFKDENGQTAESKEANKYFSLKISEKDSAFFFKNAPSNLKLTPDYRFFNFFYRHDNDLATNEELIDLLKADPKKEEDKEKVELLALYQKELGRLYNGAEFKLVGEEGQEKVEIRRKNAKGDYEKVKIDQSLLWEIGFNNEAGAIFPEDSDSQIIIDDFNMDNRLVYKEVIFNQKKAYWEKAKKEFEEKPENKDKKFGDESYIFLDQVDKILFGVNPNFVDGYFMPAGKYFELTADEIQGAIDNHQETIKKGEKGEIEYKISLDPEKGQIRILVINAFYKKADPQNAGDDRKFTSPAQEGYSKYQYHKIEKAIKAAKDLVTSSKEKMEESFNKVAESFFEIGTGCQATTKEQFKDLMSRIDPDPDQAKKQLEEIKTSLIESFKQLKLKYLDASKGEYKYNDFRFNAIRLELKASLKIGGAMDHNKVKKFGITSVIIPDVEIPFTDEFGEILTNKDLYLGAKLAELMAEKKLTEKALKADEKLYRQILKEAYDKVKEDVEAGNIVIKELAKFDQKSGKYKPVLGRTLDNGDLSINGKGLKNKVGNPINGYYTEADGKVKKIEELITDPKIKETKAYKGLLDQEIDLAGYYMHRQGYNRIKYANDADYMLNKQGHGPGIFPNESSWESGKCVGVGKCIKNAGKESGVDKTEGENKEEDKKKTYSDFELTYTPPTAGRDSEKPGMDKDSDKKEINLGEKNENKLVKFTIKVTVDKMKKEEKDLAYALGSEKEDSKPNINKYNEKGYYVYKDALVVDILPDIFQVVPKETSVSLQVFEDKLKANGANKDLNFEEFKKNIEYFYTDDVAAYLAELKNGDAAAKKRAEVLEKALEGKLLEGKKQGAILAWLPEFEAPHGSSEQFIFTLKKLEVDIKKFKEYPNPQNYGQVYKNHAAFGDSAKIYNAEKEIVITDGYKGNVNKYLQLLDKDGNVLNADQAEGWFRGNAHIKFGDKFNYKITVYRDSGVIDTGIASMADKEWKLDDLFAKVDEKGLRPILRGFAKAPEGFSILYYVGVKEEPLIEEELQEAIDSGDHAFSDVTGIKMQVGPGGFQDKSTAEFEIPMMIPEFDAKIEDGRVVYIGRDGNKVDLGDAKKFFKLEYLTNKDKDLAADNHVDGSNTVTVYLDKTRLLKIFKEFLDSQGNTIEKDRPEVKFNIYQKLKDKDGNPVKDKNGKEIRVKLDEQIILNEENGFQAGLDKLPLMKKSYKIDIEGKEGKIEFLQEVYYDYEVEEVPVPGYSSKVFKLEAGNDELGFVFKAENKREPYNPPEEPKNPPEEPKNPPEEPKNPPEEPKNPPDEPKNPPDEPNTPDEPGNPPDEPGIPKTGIKEDLAAVILSGCLLIVLILIRRKYAQE